MPLPQDFRLVAIQSNINIGTAVKGFCKCSKIPKLLTLRWQRLSIHPGGTDSVRRAILKQFPLAGSKRESQIFNMYRGIWCARNPLLLAFRMEGITRQGMPVGSRSPQQALADCLQGNGDLDPTTTRNRILPTRMRLEADLSQGLQMSTQPSWHLAFSLWCWPENPGRMLCKLLTYRTVS